MHLVILGPVARLLRIEFSEGGERGPSIVISGFFGTLRSTQKGLLKFLFPVRRFCSVGNLLINQREGKNMVARTLGFGLIGVLMATGVWGQEIITQNTTLDHDVTEGIIIARDGVTLKCANHRVSGGSRPAIQRIGRRGVTVRGCFVDGSFRGFFIRDTRSSTFDRNSVANNIAEGFRVEKSEGNVFIRNAVRNNGRDGFDLGPNPDDPLSACPGATCKGSDGNYFAVNSAIGNTANGVELDFSNHNIFVDNTFNQNGQHGVSLDDSNRNYFSGNSAGRNGDAGFQIVRRNNENTFVSNDASENRVLDAKQLESCDNIFQHT